MRKNMIQDIAPHQFSNEFLANTMIRKNDFVFHFHEKTVLLKSKGNKFYLPRKNDFIGFNENTKSTFLFQLNGTSCFLVSDDLSNYDSSIQFEDINFFRYTKQREIAFATTVAFHLFNWYAENQFCGKCSAKMSHKSDERAMECTGCSHVAYPKVSPAIIVAIICKDKLLLAHNANFPNNWYSLVAGYVDVGETLEQTVKREVMEEVGIDVTDIRFYASQPWSLSGSLMIGCIAHADDKQKIVVDGKEIEHADWFTRDDLPNYPPTASIAGEIIEKFEKGEL